jgi:hypothetical protein
MVLSTSGVAPGVYTTQVAPYVEGEMYDGTIVRTSNSLGKWQVTVQDPSALPNKVSLGVQNRFYNPDL